MIKKFLSILTVCTLCISSVFGFIACGNSGTQQNVQEEKETLTLDQLYDNAVKDAVFI